MQNMSEKKRREVSERGDYSCARHVEMPCKTRQQGINRVIYMVFQAKISNLIRTIIGTETQRGN